jgi:hypothetical protein
MINQTYSFRKMAIVKTRDSMPFSKVLTCSNQSVIAVPIKSSNYESENERYLYNISSSAKNKQKLIPIFHQVSKQKAS